jgi:hypothetical protein
MLRCRASAAITKSISGDRKTAKIAEILRLPFQFVSSSFPAHVLSQMDLDLQQPQPNQILHSYGTRIRQNISIKPSARLRQSPDPPQRLIRKIKPSPPSLQPSNPCHPPIFPLPNVTLHNDDATSKVFAAIAKSFLSVVRVFVLLSLLSFSSLPGQPCNDYQGPCRHDCNVWVQLPKVCRQLPPETP